MSEVQPLKPITVLVKYGNEFGDQEERYAGYLTGSRSAMYVVPDFGTLIFVLVEETDDPLVYLEVSGYTSIGRISDPSTDAAVIESLAKKLRGMSTYEFMEQVIVEVISEIEFEDCIIPKLIKDGQEG